MIFNNYDITGKNTFVKKYALKRREKSIKIIGIVKE
jgi:hypothetical protein